MVLLAVSVAGFAAIHLIAAAPALKARLGARFGKAWGGLFAAASTVLLAGIVLGWRSSDFVAVYEPPEWGRWVTFALVLVAFICLGIFLFRGQLRQRLRLPLAIGVVSWATGHLFANGDAASLILFGGLGAYGAFHFIIAMASGYRPSDDVRPAHDLLSVLAGVALYGLMAQLHGVIIGVSVIALPGQ